MSRGEITIAWILEKCAYCDTTCRRIAEFSSYDAAYSYTKAHYSETNHVDPSLSSRPGVFLGRWDEFGPLHDTLYLRKQEYVFIGGMEA